MFTISSSGFPPPDFNVATFIQELRKATARLDYPQAAARMHQGGEAPSPMDFPTGGWNIRVHAVPKALALRNTSKSLASWSIGETSSDAYGHVQDSVKKVAAKYKSAPLPLIFAVWNLGEHGDGMRALFSEVKRMRAVHADTGSVVGDGPARDPVA